MRLGIIGFGALGGLYGHYFSHAAEVESFFIASGERYERIRSNPLLVNGVSPDIGVEKAGEAKKPADILIFAVKHHHLEEAIEEARSHVGTSTIIFSVMNGIESEEMIGDTFGREHLLYAVALGMDAVREHNKVTFSTPGKLMIGREKNGTTADEDLVTVQNLCDKSALPRETPEDMTEVLWWKFMINVGINQTSAVLKAPYGVFIDSPHARALLEQAMEETIELAAAYNVKLDHRHIDRFVEKILPSMSREGKTSMCQDVEAGRKTEVEMFAGTVIRLGEKLNIPTPINRTLFSLIKAMEYMYLAN